MCGDCYVPVVTWGLPEQARVSEDFMNPHLSKIKKEMGKKEKTRKEEMAPSTKNRGVASQQKPANTGLRKRGRAQSWWTGA